MYLAPETQVSTVRLQHFSYTYKQFKLQLKNYRNNTLEFTKKLIKHWLLFFENFVPHVSHDT